MQYYGDYFGDVVVELLCGIDLVIDNGYEILAAKKQE